MEGIMMNDILSALDLSPARGKRLLVALSAAALAAGLILAIKYRQE